MALEHLPVRADWPLNRDGDEGVTLFVSNGVDGTETRGATRWVGAEYQTNQHGRDRGDNER